MSYPQVTNMASAQAYIANSKKPQQPSAEYLNSPFQIKAAQAKKAKEEFSAGAAGVYAKGGDQALADYYLNGDPSVVTREQSNPAKQVKQGKTTFVQAAKDVENDYNSFKTSQGKIDQNENYQVGALNNHFQFVLDNPNSGNSSGGTTKPQSNGEVSGKPVSTDSLFHWQKGKEKAQAWKKENDKVNEWKNSFNTNGDSSSFNKQYDFSGKSFTGS